MSARPDRGPKPPRHWVKRPPRPSRPVAPPPRVKPGRAQAAIALAVGLGAGLLGATLAVAAEAPEGMRGVITGIATALGLILTWRGFGGTRQDARDLFR
jgi:hypothetical protein